MAVSNNQLANEYEEIKSRFADSPFIQIVATNGTPPESYEVAYHIKGISGLADGEAVTVDQHRISIVLPFGYPHFPPNCKPLTPVFHPDFDPDAICIGDFWNASHSLAELIIHIGRMIAFQTYSRQEVFNREALDWATAHADLLPLDSADFNARPAVEGVLQLEETERPGPEVQVPAPAAAALDRVEQEAAAVPAVPSRPPVQPTSQVAARQERETGQAMEVAAAARGRGEGRRIATAAAGLALLLACAVAGLLLLGLHYYGAAREQWSGVAALVSQSKFAEADQRIKEVLTDLGRVHVLKQKEKQAMQQEIARLSGSPEFQAGLQGKVLVDGRYITIHQQQEIGEVNDLLGRGKAAADAGKWHEASEAYGKAAAKTADLRELAPVPIAQVEAWLNRSRLQGLIEDGNGFGAGQKWDQALKSYEAALKILNGMNDDELAVIKSKLGSLISDAGFNAGAAQGDQFLAAKQWSQAAESYGAALQQVGTSRADLARQIKEVEGRRAVAAFNASYEAGLKDFREGRFEAAIAGLGKSEALLASAKAGGGAGDITALTIKRNILDATLKLDEAVVAAALAKEKYGAAADTLQSLVTAIDRSPLATEKEFAAARDSALERIKNYRFQQDIQQKIGYLLSRYETIFKDFFPSSARSKLSEPKITFVKKQGGLLIFNLKCQEENRQQKFTLEMNYQYDTDSGRWSPRPAGDGS